MATNTAGGDLLYLCQRVSLALGVVGKTFLAS